jgi:hypothetical protein
VHARADRVPVADTAVALIARFRNTAGQSNRSSLDSGECAPPEGSADRQRNEDDIGIADSAFGGLREGSCKSRWGLSPSRLTYFAWRFALASALLRHGGAILCCVGADSISPPLVFNMFQSSPTR